MRIRDRFESGAPSQIWMHHLALNGTGPNERDFDHEIIKAPRLETRQRVHLRATLDLKESHGIGATHHVVHGLIAHVELTEIDRGAARVPDVQQAILHHGEHAEPQQIDLDQTDGIEIVLFPLDHGAPRHGGGFDGHDGAERLFGENETAHVNGPVTRQLMQTIDDIGEPTHALVVGIETGASEDLALRPRLTLRADIGRDLPLGLHIDELRPCAVAFGDPFRAALRIGAAVRFVRSFRARPVGGGEFLLTRRRQRGGDLTRCFTHDARFGGGFGTTDHLLAEAIGIGGVISVGWQCVDP